MSIVQYPELTFDSFALALVNIVASRMALNLKAYAASKRPVSQRSRPSTYPSFAFVSASVRPLPRYPAHEQMSSDDPSLDLEMYMIERDYQQIGTRLR